jgi:hypothetical protein
MDAVFRKLNYKNHKQVFVLNAPSLFDANISSITDTATISRIAGVNEPIEFAIGFATKQGEVNEIVNAVAPRLKGDAVFWMAYPKGSSKNYTCEFNRDTGWEILGKFNLEGVRMVAIDDDWSALRFRKINFIKTLTRSEKLALSAEGKTRSKNAERTG